jgi:hypothetical protein
MNYFINVKEYSDTQGGMFLTYRLYSGNSIEGIKGMVLDGLKGTWIDTSDDIDNLENSPSLTFDDIAEIFNNALYEEYDYSLEISDPYTGANDFFDFYLDYEENWETHHDDMEVGFYSYGEHAMLLNRLIEDRNIFIEGISASRILDKMSKDGLLKNVIKGR